MQLTLLNLDHKNATLKKLRRRAPSDIYAELHEHLRLSWVFHDHALEGVVLTERELSRGVNRETGKDVCEQLTLDGVSRLYDAIAVVRENAASRADIDLTTLKWVHEFCASDDDINAGRYRKVDGPLGAYMHESPAPKAISYRLRKLAEFVELDAERLHPVVAASEIHLQFMQVFPFDKLTGHAGRLLMNYWLMREGYPPAVLPATFRAEYYSALCDPARERLVGLVCRALNASLDFGLQLLGERHEMARANAA